MSEDEVYKARQLVETMTSSSVAFSYWCAKTIMRVLHNDHKTTEIISETSVALSETSRSLETGASLGSYMLWKEDQLVIQPRVVQ